MSTKSREVIYGARLMGARIRVEATREEARKAVQAAHRAVAQGWSLRMEAIGGPAQPSPTIAQCINGGLGWMEVKCSRCEARASIPLDCIRRPRDTPIWKLEPSFRCRSCGDCRYRPTVHMVKLTAEREVSPRPWVHPSQDDR